MIGIADALGELYEEHLAMKQGDKATLSRREKEVKKSNDWIDATFSPTKVGSAFKSLLLRADEEFVKRSAAKRALLSSSAPPTDGAYEIASGYYSTIVDWDTPWTLLAPDGLKLLDAPALHRLCWGMLLTGQGGPETNVLVLPAVYEDGTPVPVRNEHGGPHDDLPILVKTYMLTALQGRASRRKSLAAMAVQHTAMPKRLPDGLAKIEKLGNNSFEDFFGQFQNGEL